MLKFLKFQNFVIKPYTITNLQCVHLPCSCITTTTASNIRLFHRDHESRTFLNRKLASHSHFDNKRTFKTNYSENFGLFNFGSSKKITSDGTLLQRIRKKLGKTDTPKTLLLESGYYWYIKTADEINYQDFFYACDLEDTFSSWFCVVELHLWILAARFMQDGEEGRIIRNSMLQAMWKDVDVRSKKLEGALSSARKAQIMELNEQLQASFISYDEGLLGDDKVLAGALWRRFLRAKDPENEEELLKQIVALEMLVIYVRHQFILLHKMNKDQLYFKRDLKWSPFTKELLNLVDQ